MPDDRTANGSLRMSATGRYSRRLLVVVGLTGTYMVVEVVGGLLTGSLALLADAGHMATDVLGVGLALFAVWLGGRPATPQHTYGYYRAEILAALVNSALLLAVSGYILYEAWRRFQAPPEVQSLPMVAVAGVGLVVNLIGVWLLRAGAAESLNVQGAFLEVVSDLLGSLGTIVAGLIMYFTGWWYADPLFSVFIGLFILPRTWALLREAVGVLLEGTPSHVDLAEVRAVMAKVPGVVAVHDLHVWSLTSGYVALSGHANLAYGVDRDVALADLNATLRQRFGIEHTTIQIEQVTIDETRRHI